MKYIMTFVTLLFLVGCSGEQYNPHYFLSSEIERLIPKCDINGGVNGFVFKKVFATPGNPVNMIIAVECNNGATFTDSLSEQSRRAKMLWDNRKVNGLTIDK